MKQKLWNIFSQFRFASTSNFYGGDRSTIFALATGGMRSALSVIRVSGPSCSEVMTKIGRYDHLERKLPEARKAILRKLYDPITSIIVDHGILLWFPSPKSYTGEDCCEFHVHGSPAVITGLLKAIGNISGCRMAEPGEFTQRAFLNGKMDLTEVDGLADLIAAETEMQRVQALKQMSGSLSRIYESWRDRIAKCLANAEAFIDFGEDENIESDVMEKVEVEVLGLINEIRDHLKDKGRGERLRNGVRVAILGKPNVGKSTLLNLLCRREAAIVSSIPGTTRDVIESCVNIQGFPVIFADTAGIRSSTEDHIEAEGMRRSILEVEKADLIILLIDLSQLDSLAQTVVCPSDSFKRFLIREELQLPFQAEEELNKLEELEQKTMSVVNKLDLASENHSRLTFPQRENNSGNTTLGLFDSRISCKTNQGIESFYQLLTTKILDLCGDPKSDSPYLTQERYRSELESCVSSLQYFLHLSSQSTDLALRTNHLKNAINSIGAITGYLGSEDILDIIFRDFCIGK